MRPQMLAQSLAERLDQPVADMMAERIVDVLEAVDVEIADGHAAAPAPLLEPVEGLIGGEDEGRPVRQLGQGIVGGLVAGGGFAGRQFVRSPDQPAQHDGAQQAEADHGNGDQREHDCQERLARPLRRPVEVAGREIVVSDKCLGDGRGASALIRRKVDVRDQQELAELLQEVGVDPVNAQENVRRLAQQRHVDIRDDRDGGHDGRLLVNGQDRPFPGRDAQHLLQHLVMLLAFGEEIVALRQAGIAARARRRQHLQHLSPADLEGIGVLPPLVAIGVDRLVQGIDDVDLVVPVGLGQEDAEIAVDETEIGRIDDQSDGIVPPGDALLLVEGPGDALVQRILDPGPFGLNLHAVRLDAHIHDGTNQQGTGHGHGTADDLRETTQIGPGASLAFLRDVTHLNLAFPSGLGAKR